MLLTLIGLAGVVAVIAESGEWSINNLLNKIERK